MIKPNKASAPKIGISEDQRLRVVEVLNTTLSDEFVLYTTTRNFHWNVVGPQFSELHRFFDEQYQELNTIVDDVAERARSLGGRALGSLSEFLRHARLKEHQDVPEPGAMIAALLEDHETLVQALRRDLKMCAEEYEDQGTSDFLTGLMEHHEKMAWMLRAFLDPGTPSRSR
jgi:starvation-inducible DNA-binding protein